MAKDRPFLRGLLDKFFAPTLEKLMPILLDKLLGNLLSGKAVTASTAKVKQFSVDDLKKAWKRIA